MRTKIAILLGMIFFVLGLITLPHYGTNWDAINHLPRGQAYLRFLLTGKKNYDGLPGTFYATGTQYQDQKYWQNPKNLFVDVEPNENYAKTRSVHQNSNYDYEYFIKNDGNGHPAASDILSSLFNLVLFQKFHLINDIDSYRVYGVMLAAILVGIVYYWVSEKYGKLAGFVSSLSLATYPLFWAESHFNTEKDIPETVFWGIFLFLFYRGVVKKNIKDIVLSGLIYGLAMGTKFNAVFLSFVVGPWLLYHLVRNGWYKKPLAFIDKNKGFILSFFAIPILGLGLFIYFWPYLWPDLSGRLKEVINFYLVIGTSSGPGPGYKGIFGMNTYPITWIYYTTYPLVMFLAFLGIVKVIKEFLKDKTGFGILILLWLLVPISRVSLSNSNIYGGVRQIMEFIPALAILAGMGSSLLIELVRKRVFKLFLSILILLSFLPLVIKLVKIHPYENAYFNSLIGGLAGAKKQDIPYWGNTFGGAYRSAVVWLNENAEEKAKVVFAFELLPNIPTLFFRKDLSVYNHYRSGFLKQGEYAITLTFDGTEERSYYDTYLEKFVDPVFVGSVDGVSVVKAWKNDIEHTKKEYRKEERVAPVAIEKVVNGVIIDLGKKIFVSKVEARVPEVGCSSLKYGWVQLSDDKINWKILPGILPNDWAVSVLGEQPKNGYFIHPFAADRGSYIAFNLSPEDSCLGKMYDLKIYYFPDVK